MLGATRAPTLATLCLRAWAGRHTDGSWLLRKFEIERRGSQLFTTQFPSGNTADVPTLLRLHVVGRNKHPWGFGSIPIGRVQPQDVRAWINDLVIAGTSRIPVPPTLQMDRSRPG